MVNEAKQEEFSARFRGNLEEFDSQQRHLRVLPDTSVVTMNGFLRKTTLQPNAVIRSF
jgi:hypothetical protein